MKKKKKREKRKAGGEGAAAAAEEEEKEEDEEGGGEEEESKEETEEILAAVVHLGQCDAVVTADPNVTPPTLSPAKVSGWGRAGPDMWRKEGFSQGGGVSAERLSPASTEAPGGGGVSEDRGAESQQTKGRSRKRTDLIAVQCRESESFTASNKLRPLLPDWPSPPAQPLSLIGSYCCQTASPSTSPSSPLPSLCHPPSLPPPSPPSPPPPPPIDPAVTLRPLVRPETNRQKENKQVGAEQH